MTSLIKKYSIEYIFQRADKIEKSLEKGYLRRREVTELLDQIKKNSEVSVQIDDKGNLQWKIGDKIIDLHQATNKKPFWIRRIWHNIRLLNSNYEDKFLDKISKVQEAYTAYKNKLPNDNKANDNKASSLHDQLANDIAAKAVELNLANDTLSRLNQENQDLLNEIQRLNTLLQNINKNITETTENHSLLNQLNSRIKTYMFGTTFLEEQDKEDMQSIETFIYTSSKGQLLNEGARTSALTILLKKLSNYKLEKEDLDSQISTNNNLLSTKENAILLQQQECSRLQTEFSNLNQQLNPKIEDQDDDDIPIIDADKLKLKFESFGKRLKAQIALDILLSGTRKTFDKTKFEKTQDLQNNPLRSKKIILNSIAENDDFYQNFICPGLKMLTALLTSNSSDGNNLYNKWKTGFERCALLWKNSNSNSQDIDHLIPFELIFDNIFRINDIIQFVAKSDLNLVQFLTHLSTLNIPKEMDLAFGVSDDQAQVILTNYLFDPQNNDLAQLFPNTAIANWPIDCQLFLAVAIIKLKRRNNELKENSNARKDALAMIIAAENTQEPAALTVLLSLGGLYSSLFDAAFARVPSLLPKIEPEVERLKKMEAECREAGKPIDNEKYQAALVFATTPERQTFDQEFVKLNTEIRDDVVASIIAKHTSNANELGKNGKEFNVQTLLSNTKNLKEHGKKILSAEKEYITFLDRKSSVAIQNKKKKALEEAQCQGILNSINQLKTISSFLLNNSGFIKVAQAMDDSVLPNIRGQEPVNFEEQPLIPWLQDVVFKPIMEKL